MNKAPHPAARGITLTAIAAMDRNGVIGADGAMPWHVPADLRWFKNQTRGKPVVMGRKTREALDSALPGRRNIVITRQSAPGFDDCEIVHELAEAVERIEPERDGNELMILGGAEIYAAALPWTDRLLITRIEAEYDGDTWFPALDWSDWILVDEQSAPGDSETPACRFLTYERRLHGHAAPDTSNA